MYFSVIDIHIPQKPIDYTVVYLPKNKAAIFKHQQKLQ